MFHSSSTLVCLQNFTSLQKNFGITSTWVNLKLQLSSHLGKLEPMTLFQTLCFYETRIRRIFFFSNIRLNLNHRSLWCKLFKHMSLWHWHKPRSLWCKLFKHMSLWCKLRRVLTKRNDGQKLWRDEPSLFQIMTSLSRQKWGVWQGNYDVDWPWIYDEPVFGDAILATFREKNNNLYFELVLRNFESNWYQTW